MNLNMSSQNTFRLEGFFAIWALMRSFFAVTLCVLRQVAFLRERLSASRTQVWFYTWRNFETYLKIEKIRTEYKPACLLMCSFNSAGLQYLFPHNSHTSGFSLWPIMCVFNVLPLPKAWNVSFDLEILFMETNKPCRRHYRQTACPWCVSARAASAARGTWTFSSSFCSCTIFPRGSWSGSSVSTSH